MPCMETEKLSMHAINLRELKTISFHKTCNDTKTVIHPVLYNVTATQLPEPANVLAYSHNSTIVVSWTAPQYIPNRYTVFYSCHLLCDSQMLPLLAHTVHVNRTITSYTTPPLSAGSSCTTRVTAVFGSNQSNGVSNSTKTASAGTTYLCNISLPICLVYLLSSPYWCSWRTQHHISREQVTECSVG